MPETGIEDLIRNPEDAETGCLVSLGYSLGFIIILCVILGLVATYCGSSGDNQNNSNAGSQIKESK